MKFKLSIKMGSFKFKTTDPSEGLAFLLHYVPSLNKKWDVEISEAKDEGLMSIICKMRDMIRPFIHGNEVKKAAYCKRLKAGKNVADKKTIGIAQSNSPVKKVKRTYLNSSKKKVKKKLWSEREIRQVVSYCSNNKTLSDIKHLSTYKSLARRHGNSGISQLCWAIKNDRLDKYSNKIRKIVTKLK